MPKSVEEIMRRKLPLMISLFVVVAAAEGVYLCKTLPKTNTNSYGRKEHSSVVRSSDALSDEFPSVRSDDAYSDDQHHRKESKDEKILRAMLMEDSETYNDNYRAENLQNDYSILEGSPRADTVRGYVPRGNDDKAPSGIDKGKRAFTIHDYLLNRFTRNEGTRGEESGWANRRLEGNDYARFNYQQNGGYRDSQFD